MKAIRWILFSWAVVGVVMTGGFFFGHAEGRKAAVAHSILCDEAPLGCAPVCPDPIPCPEAEEVEGPFTISIGTGAVIVLTFLLGLGAFNVVWRGKRKKSVEYLFCDDCGWFFAIEYFGDKLPPLISGEGCPGPRREGGCRGTLRPLQKGDR